MIRSIPDDEWTKGDIDYLIPARHLIHVAVGDDVFSSDTPFDEYDDLQYVTEKAAPFLIVHGDRDPLVPHHQSELLESALKRAGVPVSFYTVKGGGHGGFTDPKVPELTKAFCATYLTPKRLLAAQGAAGVLVQTRACPPGGNCSKESVL